MSRAPPSLALGDKGYEERLIYYTSSTFGWQEALGPVLGKDAVADFKLLHKINLVHLESELAKVGGLLGGRDSAPTRAQVENLRVLLRDHATAVRDYSYLQSLSSVHPWRAAQLRQELPQIFPEVTTVSAYGFDSTRFVSLPHQAPPATIDTVRAFLKRHLPVSLAYSLVERNVVTEHYDAAIPPEKTSIFVDLLARLIIAVVGGASLVVPMIIMAIGSSQTKSLVTVSIAVLLFALVMAFAIKASNLETLGATATYAAVLVVFVGTSSSPGNP